MTSQDRQNLIEIIRGLPDELKEAIEGLSDEQMNTPYGEGKWTVIQLVNHLADSHLNGFSRMKMVATEEHPKLKPYDQDAWARLADTNRYPIGAALQILRGVHERWAVVLESLEDSAWERMAYHPEVGDMTLGDLLEDYADHGKKHIGHIMGLRRAKGW